MNIDEFLKMEREHRKAGKWFMGQYDVIDDHGQIVRVSIKQHGFYSQILKLGIDPTNYAFGHTIDKVGEMHEYLRTQINEANAHNRAEDAFGRTWVRGESQ